MNAAHSYRKLSVFLRSMPEACPPVKTDASSQANSCCQLWPHTRPGSPSSAHAHMPRTQCIHSLELGVGRWLPYWTGRTPGLRTVTCRSRQHSAGLCAGWPGACMHDTAAACAIPCPPPLRCWRPINHTCGRPLCSQAGPGPPQATMLTLMGHVQPSLLLCMPPGMPQSMRN